MTVDGVAVHRVGNVVEDRARDHRVEDYRHSGGSDFARAQALQRAPRSLTAHGFRRIELCQGVGSREPVIALHVALFILNYGRGGDGARRAAVVAQESQRVGHHFAAGGSVEPSPISILEALLSLQPPTLAPPR